MGSVLLGIEAASALSDLILHAAQAQQRISQMINDANLQNNGELTPDQVSQIQAMRHAAVSALDAAVKAQQ